MNRANLTYVFFCVVLVVGLWAVLTVGGTLSAVPDISGVWRAVEGTQQIAVQQSGRYVHVTINGRTLDGTIHQRPESVEGRVEAIGNVESKADDSFWSFTREPGAETADVVLPAGAGQVRMARIEGASASDHQVPAATPTHAPNAHPLLTLLLQLTVIIVVSRLVGFVFLQVGQPQVMGEMVAGILLGPSLFGWLAPEAAGWIFPRESIGFLGLLSQIGVVFFLFLIGLELDPKLLRNRGHAALVISHASIIAPFLLGGALTLFLYPRLFNDTQTMRFTAVALFMGAAMSITAFPVLARILSERNLTKTKVGAVAITCAAVDDVTAWCMLAMVVAVARADNWYAGLITTGYSLLYVGAMYFVVRPLLRRFEGLFEATGRLTQAMVAVIVVLVLASAYTTELIGIHALFGAFLMGTMMPKGTRFVRTLSEKLEDYTVVFLLPVFFAYTGLKTQIGLIDSGELWLVTLLIIGVACLGKFGGSAAASLACGLGARESGAIGILMNTRGLMELVILNIGRELGVITDAVFAMMVIMALVTTALTTPVLNLIYPDRLLRREKLPRGKPSPGTRAVLIPISLPRSGRPLLRLADALAGPRSSERRITALHLRRPADHEAYRSGLDEVEASAESLEPLQPLLEEARERGIDVEPLSFVTRDVAGDISRIVEEQGADLVLMGFHKPVLGATILGGTVNRVLTSAGADVAVFVDRGFHQLRRILVPYIGGGSDRFALQLADSMARNAATAGAAVSITVLHVVPPNRDAASPTLNAKRETERVFSDPSQQAPVTFKVLESDEPVDAVIAEAPQYDLVVIAVGEEWGLESHYFALRPERIARDCPTSMLIVRQGDRLASPRPTSEAPTPPLAPKPA